MSAQPPENWGKLGSLSPELALMLASVTSDIALILDEEGVVSQVSCGDARNALGDAQQWMGRSWVDTVTSDTRQKAEALLRDAAAKGSSGPRQIHHHSGSGSEIPITYSAIRLGERGLTLAVGRDLRSVAAIQRQLIETQQAMERDYWQMRQAETRYRLLFQMASDAVLVVDAAGLRVQEANRAAGRLFGIEPEKLVGKPATFGVDPVSYATLEELLASARVTGRSSEVLVRLDNGGVDARVSATPFRSEGATLLLMRIRAIASGETTAEPDLHLQGLFANTPDAVVVTDGEGLVQKANPAFLDLAQVANEESARGRPLSNWIGRPGGETSMIFAIVRKSGSVRMVSTQLLGEHGQATEVELSAAAFSAGDRDYVGFVIRGAGRWASSVQPASSDIVSAVERLTSKLGQVSLPDLVQDTTDLVERHYIAAALQLSGNNRTTAAEILGLSRQSLYVKLKRYRLDGGKKTAD
jgi:transcriptional regulator PpsR